MKTDSCAVKRCHWVNLKNPIYVEYHDREWGVPFYDDRYLFEMLILESFQAGLSWECVLNKRGAFRRAFDGFDPAAVAAYGAEKKEALVQNADIIRNRRKIEAAVKNAAVFLKLQQEFGSFSAYIWGFTDGRQIRYGDGILRATSPLSDEISKDLKRRGMSFVGSVIIYSYLQAIGVIYSHDKDCFLYK